MKTLSKFTILFTLIFFIFPTSTGAEQDAQVSCISRDEISLKVPDELKSQSIIPFEAKTLDEAVSPVALYVDDENTLKAALIKCVDFSDDITFTVGDTSVQLSEPDDDGYIYQYYNKDITLTGDTEVTFTRDDEVKTSTLPTTKIVTTEDEWDADGNKLYFYNGDKESLVIPNFYNGKIITDLGGYVDDDDYLHSIFSKSQNKNISTVTVSAGIQNIGHAAFYNYEGLKSISLPNSIETIGYLSFALTSLEGDLTIPENTISIYPYAFYGTNITSVDFNNRLEEIYYGAFASCSKLSCDLVFPESLTMLGEQAFMSTPIYGDLTIPGNVKTIGDACFCDCQKLTGKLILSEGVEEIGFMTFGGNGNKSIYFSELQLPSTLKKIGSYAFQNCTAINHLDLPEGLETISDGAFDHMSGIDNTTLVIPSTVSVIGGDYNVEKNTNYGDHVFYDMGKDSLFTTFEVADGNQNFTAVDGVLYTSDMTRLVGYPRGKTDSRFVLPNTITQLDQLSFSRNKYLKTLVLPDNYIITDELPENALNKDSNTLSGALYVYTGIEKIEINDTNPNYSVQDGVVYSKDFKTLWYMPTQYQGSLKINDECENMAQGSFFVSDNQSLQLTDIVIPKSLMYIDSDILGTINARIKNKLTTVSVEGDMYFKLDEDRLLTEVAYTAGDVNMDSQIDSADTAGILRYLINLPTSDKFNKKAADLNGDGKITILDAIKSEVKQ